MTDDNLIPLAEFNASCPQCGAQLGLKRDDVEAKDKRRVFCPIHNDIGSLKEVRATLIDQNRDEIIDKAKKAARNLIKGFKLK